MHTFTFFNFLNLGIQKQFLDNHRYKWKYINANRTKNWAEKGRRSFVFCQKT